MNTSTLTNCSRISREAARMTPHGREGKGREQEGKGTFGLDQVQIVKAVEGRRLNGLGL